MKGFQGLLKDVSLKSSIWADRFLQVAGRGGCIFDMLETMRGRAMSFRFQRPECLCGNRGQNLEPVSEGGGRTEESVGAVMEKIGNRKAELVQLCRYLRMEDGVSCAIKVVRVRNEFVTIPG